MTESFLAGRERVATMASRRSSASRRRLVPVLGMPVTSIRVP